MTTIVFQCILSIQHLKNVHVTVESVDDINNPEEYIVVFGAVFFFTMMDALSNFLKPLRYQYPTNKGGVTEEIPIVYRK